jgi:hypothetical protein
MKKRLDVFKEIEIIYNKTDEYFKILEGKWIGENSFSQKQIIDVLKHYAKKSIMIKTRRCQWL